MCVFCQISCFENKVQVLDEDTQKKKKKKKKKKKNNEAQLSRGTERRRDEEQTMPKQTPHTITKTRLFKYIENFTPQNIKFSNKVNLIFFIFQLKTYIVGTR